MHTKATDTTVTKETTVQLADRDFTVISIFEGTESASKIIYDLAVNRILYEKVPMDDNR